MRDTELTTSQIADALTHLICDTKWSPSEALETACGQCPELGELVQRLVALRDFSSALSKGELNEPASGKGYVMGNLKAMQANLQHLVWQMDQVSKGDFSQRVDFMGSFSESFNAMCEKLQRYSEVLNEQARIDALTQLANRTHIDEYLEALFRSARQSGDAFAIMMIDIDHFKRVNDSHGHDVGDIVLVRAASYLKAMFRDSDFVGRYGGEEFIAALPKIPPDQARTSAARVLKCFNENPIIVSDSLSIPITVSIGVSHLRPDDTEPAQVIKRSDIALYLAKQSGRNRAEYA